VAEEWLESAMKQYNQASYDAREAYPAILQMPGKLLGNLIQWCLEALPDEILVGLDISSERQVRKEVSQAFTGPESRDDLFAGQGYTISEAQVVNRGNSMTVHHLPEEWTDEIFGAERGPRGGRFTHWLHTHPNAPAIPSGPDAAAAQWTEGVDLILGVEFSPAWGAPWVDGVEGERRMVAGNKRPEGEKGQSWFRQRMAREKRPVLGRAKTGHSIHGIELIAFHRSGVGVNILFVDENNLPYGWPFPDVQ
jgi:hypothetical protein